MNAGRNAWGLALIAFLMTLAASAQESFIAQAPLPLPAAQVLPASPPLQAAPAQPLQAAPIEGDLQPSQALGQATGHGTGNAADLAARPAATLVLDVSNSMWGQIDGQAKIEIARNSVRTLLGSWNLDADLGLVAYGHNRTSDCTDIETLRQAAPLDAAAFGTLVNNLTPRGKTPLTQAVRQAAEELSIQDRPASVILFSDGIDTCGGDPCALASELERMGVDFTVHVVGFSVAADERQLACLAETTGGLYLSADTAPQLQMALQTVASRAADPAASDLVTLEAVDPATGQPIAAGVIWTVTSLAGEDTVPLTAGVSRPALPLAPGGYVAEAAVGTAVGRASFEVTANGPQTVQVRLDTVAPPLQRAAACVEPNDSFASPGPVDTAGGIRDSIYPQGDVDFCGLDVGAPGVLTIAASAAPEPLDVVVRVNDIDRKAVRDWTGELLPGAAPVEADLPEPGRYVLEVSDSYSDASAPDPYALTLAFTAVVDATEPNESLTRPATLPLDTPIDVAVFPRGEHNFLAVEVEEHGELTVTTSGVPKAIDVAMRLFGPDHAILKDWQSAPAGVDNVMTVDLPRPGRYVVELADSYDDARSPQAMKLEARFVASADANEPNDTTVQATNLAFDLPVRITLLPRADQDYFLLDAPHRGRITVSATGVPGIDVAVRLLDDDREVVRDWAVAPATGVPFSFEADLPARGRYWLHLADAYDDGRSVQPITLTASLAAAEDALEQNDRPRDAKPLPLGAVVEATILPLGDHDFYLVDAAAATLTVKAGNVPPNVDVALRLFDADLAVIGNWVVAPAPGVDMETTFEIPAQGRYWLEVADSYDDASAPASFTLTATQP